MLVQSSQIRLQVSLCIEAVSATESIYQIQRRNEKEAESGSRVIFAMYQSLERVKKKKAMGIPKIFARGKD